MIKHLLLIVFSLSSIHSFSQKKPLYGENNIKLTAVLSLSANPAFICTGSSSTLSASGAASYTWEPGTIVDSILVVSPAITTIYTVTSSAPVATATVEVTVGTMPTITAVANPTVICAGDSTTITATGAGSYTWLPGGLAGSLVSVYPTSSTIYTVTGNINGCSGSATVQVVNPASTPLLLSGNINCNDTIVQVSLPGLNNSYVVQWAGPGIVGPANTGGIQADSAGSYYVVITDTLTNCSSMDSVMITSSIGPLVLDIVPSSTLTCFPGPPVNILVKNSAYYTWLPMGTTTPSTGPLVSTDPDVTTTFTILATLGVCSGSAALTISVNPTPTVVNTSGSPTICSGRNATLSAAGAANFEWVPGDLQGDSVIVSPQVTTVYSFTGSTDNCSASDGVLVTVLHSPALVPSASPSVICAGQTATLSATDAATFTWQPLGGVGSNFVVTPAGSSVYTVSGTNSLGCTSTATVFLTAHIIPTLNTSSTDALICLGETVAIAANGSNKYNWQPGNLFGFFVTYSPTVSTIYTVTSGSPGCTSSKTTQVLVYDCSLPRFGLTNAASAPLPEDSYYVIVFTVTAVNASAFDLQYVSLSSELSATFRSPITFTLHDAPAIIGKKSALVANKSFDGITDQSLLDETKSTLQAGSRDTIVYSLRVDPHGFSGEVFNSVTGAASLRTDFILADSSNTGFKWDANNNGDPTDDNAMTVIELKALNLFIPNGFSPDGDGLYDHFVIDGIIGRHSRLTVFNRWGNRVYDKENYDNSWNGESNIASVKIGSGKLPAGTYYYILEFSDGAKEQVKGFVVLQY